MEINGKSLADLIQEIREIELESDLNPPSVSKEYGGGFKVVLKEYKSCLDEAMVLSREIAVFVLRNGKRIFDNEGCFGRGCVSHYEFIRELEDGRVLRIFFSFGGEENEDSFSRSKLIIDLKANCENEASFCIVENGLSGFFNEFRVFLGSMYEGIRIVNEEASEESCFYVQEKYDELKREICNILFDEEVNM